jgi:OOP family OmpA-OmpF porin
MLATKTLILAGIAAALLPGMSAAQDTKNQGYLVDTQGQNAIVHAPVAGVCVRTSDWTPARAVAECDPVAPRAAAPAPKVAAVAPPPPKPAAKPTPAPARAVPQSVTFSADALFAFDKSVLKPEGKAALDDFARQLSGAQYDTILVTGHTDRFGTNAYNQKLSERRANAVKNYLVSKNVPANRITAEGKGETQPVTSPGDCKGAKSVKVIACLQPDRRVHVVVTGAKVPATSPR